MNLENSDFRRLALLSSWSSAARIIVFFLHSSQGDFKGSTHLQHSACISPQSSSPHRSRIFALVRLFGNFKHHLIHMKLWWQNNSVPHDKNKKGPACSVVWVPFISAAKVKLLQLKWAKKTQLHSSYFNNCNGSDGQSWNESLQQLPARQCHSVLSHYPATHQHRSVVPGPLTHKHAHTHTHTIYLKSSLKTTNKIAYLPLVLPSFVNPQDWAFPSLCLSRSLPLFLSVPNPPCPPSLSFSLPLSLSLLGLFPAWLFSLRRSQ